jgi:hypothetical protein
MLRKLTNGSEKKSFLVVLAGSDKPIVDITIRSAICLDENGRQIVDEAVANNIAELHSVGKLKYEVVQLRQPPRSF